MMSKAYLNALYEEGTKQECFDWLCKVDADNDDLRRALKFYADKDNWDDLGSHPEDEYVSKTTIDRGEIARCALVK